MKTLLYQTVVLGQCTLRTKQYCQLLVVVHISLPIVIKKFDYFTHEIQETNVNTYDIYCNN